MPIRDWALIRKYLIKNYNSQVLDYFTSHPDDDLKNLCLIKSSDSALIADIRMDLFDQEKSTQDLNEIAVHVFDKCDGITPIWKQRTVRCLPGTESTTVLLFQYLADLSAQRCKPSECYAAVPEWWQIRLEGGRPQLIILFAEVDSSGNVVGSAKNPISIPHPIVNRATTAPLPNYQKGQYEAMLTLKDNSKVIINAVSADEADRLMDACKTLIQPEYLDGAIQRPTAPRKGVSLLQIKVKAVQGEYFSTGMKNTKPDWVDTYT